MAAARRAIRRITEKMHALSGQGVPPERLALSLALGGALGVFPVVGTSTLLCIALGIALRLNHVALQAANQSMYLVQLALLPLFLRVGQALAGAPPGPRLEWTQIQAAFWKSPWSLGASLGPALGHSVLGWAACAPVLALALYVAVLPLLRPRGRTQE